MRNGEKQAEQGLGDLEGTEITVTVPLSYMCRDQTRPDQTTQPGGHLLWRSRKTCVQTLKWPLPSPAPWGDLATELFLPIKWG